MEIVKTDLVYKNCRKCSLSKDLSQFYVTKNLRSYPDGHINWCKMCMRGYKKVSEDEIVETPFRIETGKFVMTFD